MLCNKEVKEYINGNTSSEEEKEGKVFTLVESQKRNGGGVHEEEIR